MADLRITATVYCDECRRAIRLQHVPMVEIDGEMTYDLAPALTAHSAQH